jgi:hypothetical protein
MSKWKGLLCQAGSPFQVLLVPMVLGLPIRSCGLGEFSLRHPSRLLPMPKEALDRERHD